MKVIESPNPIDTIGTSLFLAGSIEMGAAENWQDKMIAELAECEGTILNPRRKAWDLNWSQSPDNPHFKEQVLWELRAMEKADIIVYWFDPNTKAPITLLELGLYARSKKSILVGCPSEFWRSGNVAIVCEFYNLNGLSSFQALAATLKFALKHKH